MRKNRRDSKEVETPVPIMVSTPTAWLYTSERNIVTQVLYGTQGEILSSQPRFGRMGVELVLGKQCHQGSIDGADIVSGKVLPPQTEKVVVVARTPSVHLLEEPSFFSLPVWSDPVFLGSVFGYTGESHRNRETGDFYQVYLPWGSKAWLAKENTLLRPASSPFPKPKSGQEIVELASRMLGDHYQWGGMTCGGWDCSGLTHIIARVFGKNIPRNSIKQWEAKIGQRIEPGEDSFNAGDFIYYQGEPYNHCGIADGKGNIIHAEGIKEIQVVQWPLDDDRLGSLTLLGAKRFWNFN